jgi:hypothetical protein
MRAISERPRFAAAAVLAVIALVMAGVVIGSGNAGGADAGVRAGQVAAQRAAGRAATQLVTTRAELARTRLALAAAMRRWRSAQRVNAQLRVRLRAARKGQKPGG